METLRRKKRRSAAPFAVGLLIHVAAASQALPFGGSDGVGAAEDSSRDAAAAAAAALGDSSTPRAGPSRRSSVDGGTSVEVLLQQQQQQEEDMEGLLSPLVAALEGDSDQALLLPISSIDEDVFHYPVENIMASKPMVWLPSQRQANQRGSGEKYEKLLSKGSDFEHLPEMHPARLQADSRAIKRRSFHTVLAGIVLATAYVAFYLYQTSGSGVRTHLERHILALNRISSTTSGFIWVAAWRLWMGLVLSGMVSLALNAYRIHRACKNSKARVLPMWLVVHWKLLVGVPLLVLLLASGNATQLAMLDNAAAVSSSAGILGSVLAHSSPAAESFLLDAFLQAPFGLVFVGLVRLLIVVSKAARRRLRSGYPKKQEAIPREDDSFKVEERQDSPATGAVSNAVQTLEALLPFRDRTDSRSRGNGTKKKNKTKRSLSEHSGIAELHAEQVSAPPTETSHSVPKARRRRVHTRHRHYSSKQTQTEGTSTDEGFSEPEIFEETPESKEEYKDDNTEDQFEHQQQQDTSKGAAEQP